ncbi:MAG: NYN domain-containing protein [Oscillospiraceae bacterium]|jgi:uncharacterized LabA/DUF88 family protein|nr:NYN domain-containing protein [Oscillospiraceae bacterium]
MVTAIMVDGGFYKKRARQLFGEKPPEERADELYSYCCRHLREKTKTREEEHTLYRIFYYDCPPSEKSVMHPITKHTVDLRKSAIYTWTTDFFLALTAHRKVALRMGELLESSGDYVLRSEALKRLLRKEIEVDALSEKDFTLDFKQKGVDMRIGLDIASLAHKRLVSQIVLIAGDSDFVPAAKHARREGIDFILDPMWQPIKPTLHLHIDGLRTVTKKPADGAQRSEDRLCAAGGSDIQSQRSAP